MDGRPSSRASAFSEVMVSGKFSKFDNTLINGIEDVMEDVKFG